MTRPRLSVVGVTRDSGDRLERWATLAREYADEIALLVDASSVDDTVEVARRVADRVQVVDHPPVNELTMDRSLRFGRGEWLLYLDDDEVLDPGFAGVVDELLSDREATHYWQPERWVVRRPDGGYGWLKGFPWYPDHHLRLLRGIEGLYSHRGRLHSPIDVAGEGRVLDDPATAIYHLQFLMRGRKERERRMDRYKGLPAPSCEEYYLWEDYASSTEIEPMDVGVVERSASVEALTRAAGAAATLAPLEGPPVPVEVLQASVARHWDTAEIYSADYACLGLPERMLANRGYNAAVEIRNTSAVRWRTTGGAGRVELGYHWAHADHGMLLRDGDVTLLPGRMGPGERVVVPAGFWTPYEPGTYELQLDLRSSGRSWFSERGVPPLRVRVEVGGGERLLATPRIVARLPRRAHAAPDPAAAAAHRDPAGATPPGPVDAGPATGPGMAPAAAGHRHLRRVVGPVVRHPSVQRLAARILVTPPQPATTATTATTDATTAAATTTHTTNGPANAPSDRTHALPRGTNVVALTPIRLIDTRNGSGVPGVPHGPIAAGDEIVIDVIAHPHVPDTAVGIVGDLSVVASDFDGYLSVHPTGAAGAGGTVSVFFDGSGRPVVNQVVAALGHGPDAGQLSVHVSDSGHGSVEFILDVTAYLD